MGMAVTLFVIGLIITFRYLKKRDPDSYYGPGEVIGTGMFFSVVVALLYLIVCILPAEAVCGTTEVTVETLPLHGAVDNTTLYGRAFLGTGYLHGSSVYSGYVIRENGRMDRFDINTKQAGLYLDAEDGTQAYRREYKEVVQCEGLVHSFLFIDGTTMRWGLYDLHIPPGSISLQYNMDLE